MPKTPGQLKLEEERATNAKQPDTWEDLPELIWAKVLKYLGSNDVNNIHLISRKFHNIANMYSTSGKLIISAGIMSSKIHLKALMKSSRKFQTITIFRGYFDNQNLNFFNKNYKVLLDIVKKFGVYTENLFLSSVHFNLLELLKNLPKLKKLIFFDTHHKAIETDQHQMIQLPHLKNIEVMCCEKSMYKIFDHLEGSAIRKVTFWRYNVEKVKAFLKRNQLNIKELCLESHDEDQYDVLADLENMQLDLFDMFTGHCRASMLHGDKFVAFLRRQPNLKSLCLQRDNVSDENLCIAIEAMPNLETLILQECYFVYLTSTSTDQLHKLTKLKKLVVDLTESFESDQTFPTINENYLTGLKKTINENVQELETFLPEVSEEFMAELAASIPNLKKLKIKTRSHTAIELVMKYFKKLEELKIEYNTYSNDTPKFSLDEKVLLNLKLFRLTKPFEMDSKVAIKLVNNFPNLEHLEIYRCLRLTARCVKILLKGMKKLKTLRLDHDEVGIETRSCSISRDEANGLVQAHAKCLQEFKTSDFSLNYNLLYGFYCFDSK